MKNYGGLKYRNKYELPERIHKYASFADATYSPKEEVHGYHLDSKLSTDQFKVYAKGNKVVFAIRGSTTAGDFLVSDLQIGRVGG